MAPIKIREGFRLPPVLGEWNRAFTDHLSVEYEGKQFLYEKMEHLLLDLHFKFQGPGLEFDKSPAGHLPRFRVTVRRLWDIEEDETFFVIRFFDALSDCANFIRGIATVLRGFTSEQGFGIHRFNPEKAEYEFDDALFQQVAQIVRELDGGTGTGGPGPGGTGTGNRALSVGGAEEDAAERGRKPTFISSNSDDYGLAQRVYELMRQLSCEAFFAPVSLKEKGKTEYATQIDIALDRSDNLIVVASAPRMFESSWFDQEWRTWVNEKRSGRKSGNILSVVGDDFQISKLPIALRFFEVVPATSLGTFQLRQYF